MSAVVVSRQKLDADRQDAAQNEYQTELHSVMLMVEYFRNEIGQSDAEKSSGRKGEGTADNVRA